MNRRLWTGIASVALVLPSAVVAGASPSLAACPEYGQVYYKFTNVTTSSRPTSVMSAYIEGPGSISRTVSETATTSASMSATVAAEAGVVFAKASTSIGVGVGKDWSKTSSWSYTLNVAAGTTARVRLYHESRRFTVTKQKVNAYCGLSTVYTSTVDAPRTSSTSYAVFKREYK